MLHKVCRVWLVVPTVALLLALAATLSQAQPGKKPVGKAKVVSLLKAKSAKAKSPKVGATAAQFTFPFPGVLSYDKSFGIWTHTDYMGHCALTIRSDGTYYWDADFRWHGNNPDPNQRLWVDIALTCDDGTVISLERFTSPPLGASEADQIFHDQHGPNPLLAAKWNHGMTARMVGWSG